MNKLLKLLQTLTRIGAKLADRVIALEKRINELENK